MREPWFRILEVIEPRGRSMADIVAEVAKRHGVSVREIRSHLQHAYLREARAEAIRQIKTERPDLVSTQVARFFNRESSNIRRQWRRAPDQQASAA